MRTLTFPPSIPIVLPASGPRSQLNHGPFLDVDFIFTRSPIIVHSANYGVTPQVSGRVETEVSASGRGDDENKPTHHIAHLSSVLRQTSCLQR